MNRSPTIVLLLLAPALPAQIFGTPENLAMPPGGLPRASAFGDLNGDGAPDLVTFDSGRAVVALGNGAGGFAPATAVALPGATFGGALQLVDGNGDGHLDLWVGHLFGILEVRGDGTGSFPTVIQHLTFGRAFCVADVDGDQRPDFVAAMGGGVGVQKGDGVGGFGAPVQVYATVFTPAVILSGDLDGDRNADLLLMSGLGAEIRVLLGDGLGQFTPSGVPFQSGVIGARAWLADLDGDERPDLVTSNQDLIVHWNDGFGHFQGPGITLDPLPREVAIADFDGDGRVDLVRPDIAGIALVRGDGIGGFLPPVTFPVTFLGLAVAAADLDRDGRTDVVMSGATVSSVLRNQIPTPPGIVAYGDGTPACGGTIGIWGSPEPAIGETAFHVLCSNAPRDSIGLLALGTGVAAGWDPLGWGLTLHLGFALPIATMSSDAGGSARAPLPIPSLWFLAGLKVHVQSLWFADPGRGDTCSTAQFELASSRGLAITLQP
jgi:hypothetical protein